MAPRKRKTPSKDSSKKYNKDAQWKTYRALQLQADRAWKKLKDDVKKNAKSDVLVRDNNHLLLLLGECNYMARECMRIAGLGKKRAR